MKWSKGDSIAGFERFFDDELNYDVMLQRVRVPDQTRGQTERYQDGHKLLLQDSRFTSNTMWNQIRACRPAAG